MATLSVPSRVLCGWSLEGMALQMRSSFLLTSLYSAFGGCYFARSNSVEGRYLRLFIAGSFSVRQGSTHKLWVVMVRVCWSCLWHLKLGSVLGVALSF